MRFRHISVYLLNAIPDPCDSLIQFVSMKPQRRHACFYAFRLRYSLLRTPGCWLTGRLQKQCSVRRYKRSYKSYSKSFSDWSCNYFFSNFCSNKCNLHVLRASVGHAVTPSRLSKLGSGACQVSASQRWHHLHDCPQGMTFTWTLGDSQVLQAVIQSRRICTAVPKPCRSFDMFRTVFCNFFVYLSGFGTVIWKSNQIDGSSWDHILSDSMLCGCIDVFFWQCRDFCGWFSSVQ